MVTPGPSCGVSLHLCASSGCLLQKCFSAASLPCWEPPRAGHSQEECEGLADWEERLIKKIMMCDILLLQRIILSPNNIIGVCPPKSIHAMEDGRCREKEKSYQGSGSFPCNAWSFRQSGSVVRARDTATMHPCSVNDATWTYRGRRRLESSAQEVKLCTS